MLVMIAPIGAEITIEMTAVVKMKIPYYSYRSFSGPAGISALT